MGVAMKIRKLTMFFNGKDGDSSVRYDIMLDGNQKHISNCSDEEAINWFESLNGKKTQCKPFPSGSILQEWIKF